MLPEGIALEKEIKIVEHLNSTYELSLVKIDEHSIKTIPNGLANFIAFNHLEYRKTKSSLNKLESYMCLVGPDDRIRDEIDQLNTKTGRFYRSLQKVTRSGPMRSMFQPKEGYKFIRADYSQQEARIIAGLSNDQAAIALFKADKDIYLETAHSIFGTKGDSQRYRKLAKKIVLGLNNGQSSYKICEELNQEGYFYDPDEVNYYVSLFNQRFPAIDIWQTKLLSQLKKRVSSQLNWEGLGKFQKMTGMNP